jgi:hypothetical protein
MDVSSTKVVFDWMKGLPEKDGKKLFSRINMLRDKGRRMLSNTGYLKALAGEEELFEISVSTRGKEYRLITWIGTDDWDEAIVLSGGDKVGDDRFYEQQISKAKRRLESIRSDE